MPITPTYPGVYIEELPSGVHTITGVATSIAAFIGWAPEGPIDKARLVLSWSEYNTRFGGLDSRSKLGYAVNHFFNNGGQQAYIIRLVNTDTANGAVAVAANATIGTGTNTLTVTALDPGAWGNDYQVAIKNQTGGTNRFRLQVIYAPAGATPAVVESFENLSVISPDPQGRYVVDVLTNSSSYVSAQVGAGATAPPGDGTTTLGTGVTGVDGFVLLPNSAAFEKALIPTSGIGGVHLLDHVDLFNLLCVPAETTTSVLSTLDQYCGTQRAFLIADSDPSITDYTVLISGSGLNGPNAAYYFPWIQAPDPLAGNVTRSYPPCGFVAGVYATTDANRGVWKAPAGTETALVGVTGVAVPLSDSQNGFLNPVAVNCIRNFSAYGTVVWGARTTQGNDEAGSQWKYVSIRRLAKFLETTFIRSSQWIVFEPNDEPLWAQIRLNFGSFMQTLFKQGAFQGSTPQQAYFVKCDSETTTSTDQDNGIVNILVGFAPLKPAEFVIIQLQQMAGQSAN